VRSGERQSSGRADKTHQLDVRAHLGDLPDLNHDEFVHLRIPRLVVAHLSLSARTSARRVMRREGEGK
jgi:hypothetical protein